MIASLKIRYKSIISTLLLIIFDEEGGFDARVRHSQDISQVVKGLPMIVSLVSLTQ